MSRVSQCFSDSRAKVLLVSFGGCGKREKQEYYERDVILCYL
jgi:hypothetical protein